MSDTFSAIAQTPEAAKEAAVAVYRTALAMLANGDLPRLACEPALEPIGIQQRRFFHGAVLKQISEQVRVGPKGERYTMDAWKEFYRRKFLGDGGFRWEVMRLPGAKRSTPRRIPVSTEELGVRGYAEFTNQVIDDAVLELGVEFVFTTEERELVARKPRGSHVRNA